MRLFASASACTASLLLFFQSPASAAPAPSVSLSVDRLFGYSTYHISFPWVDEGIEGTGESKLEFPVDVFMAGIRVSSTGGWAAKWRLSGGLRRDVNDPGGPMKDSDWMPLSPSTPRWQFSYTESEASLTAWMGELEGAYRLYAGTSLELWAELGYHYKRLSYNLFGVRGWYDDGGGRQPYPPLGNTTKVLAYRVSYHLPLATIRARGRAIPWLEGEAALGFSPYAHAKDADDHLLRNKRSKASCTGFAYSMEMKLVGSIPSSSTTYETVVELRVGWSRIDTGGNQSQYWYGDDPVTPDLDDTGLRASGIDDEITASVGFVSLAVGRRF